MGEAAILLAAIGKGRSEIWQNNMREFRWAATQNKTREYSTLGDRRQVFEMAGTGGRPRQMRSYGHSRKG